MEPYGDPEARIRDLERPLADQAQANEMGTRSYEAPPTSDVPAAPYSYGAPPPPPPPPGPYPGASYPQYGSPQYNSPYYAPPQQVVQKRSNPALWLIPLVIGVIVVAGAIGAVVWFNLGSSGTVSSPGSNPPGISGSGGSVDTPGVDVPTIPKVPGIEIPINPTEDVVTVNAGDSVSIGGIERHQTVVCNQGTVNISGMNNTVEITGSCANVGVSGMENVITVETSVGINVSGFDNKVTYHTGSPEISQSGSGNVIEQG